MGESTGTAIIAALEATRDAGHIASIVEAHWPVIRAALADYAGQPPTPGAAATHLGAVLYFLADLHPDDRCQALDDALAFYNAQCLHAQVAPQEGYVSRLVITTPFDVALGRGA